MSILVLDNLSKTSGINIILFVDGKTLILAFLRLGMQKRGWLG